MLSLDTLSLLTSGTSGVETLLTGVGARGDETTLTGVGTRGAAVTVAAEFV